jgi:hypothetical protein
MRLSYVIRRLPAANGTMSGWNKEGTYIPRLARPGNSWWSGFDIRYPPTASS